MKELAATSGQNIGNISGGGLGPFGNLTFSGQGGAVTALEKIASLLSTVVGFMTVCAGIYFMFMIIIGGYDWLSAGGDTKKLQSARERITNAFLGLVIVVGAWALIALVGQIFGFDILLGSPGTIIQNLRL